MAQHLSLPTPTQNILNRFVREAHFLLWVQSYGRGHELIMISWCRIAVVNPFEWEGMSKNQSLEKSGVPFLYAPLPSMFIGFLNRPIRF